MRSVLLVIAAASLAQAGEVAPRPRNLTSTEIKRYAAPYFEDVKACYLQHRPAHGATGHLSLRVEIGRGGSVESLAIEAPGLTRVAAHALDRCIRARLETWHFPVRRRATTAIIPYFFLDLDLPGTGPQLGCWNPRGCPTHPPFRAAPRPPRG